MPHIDKMRRVKLLEFKEPPRNAGELNFLFTKLAWDYITLNGGENYQRYNDVIGALEGAKLELYRIKISLYEDKKIQENGSAY